MFESILERILKNYLGRFINGVDSNNLHLGVWKGDVRVENVSIRSDVLDNLECAVRIKASNIGSLSMKVPWTKLSSMPVQVVLENIFVLVEPIDDKSWNFEDEKALARKLSVIQNYIAMCIDKFLLKKESLQVQAAEESNAGEGQNSNNNGAGSQSYIARLTKKIADNLELTIKKIHLRWEDKAQTYSWGFSLEELSLSTCDADWKVKFYDGTQQAEKLIRKLGVIKNLSLYWNDKETQFLSKEGQSNIAGKMLDFSQKDRKEVVNLSGQVKITQDEEKKETTLQIKQEKLEFQVKEAQVVQISKLLEKVSMYKKLLWMAQNDAKKPEEHTISEQELIECKEIFLETIAGVKNTNEEISSLKGSRLGGVLRKVKYETLFEWAREHAKKKIKEETIDIELEKRRKAKWFFQRGKNDGIMSQEEQDSIEAKIEQEFMQEKDFLSIRKDIISKSSNNNNQSKKSMRAEFSLSLLRIMLQEGQTGGLQLDVKEIRMDLGEKGQEQKLDFQIGDIELRQNGNNIVAPGINNNQENNNTNNNNKYIYRPKMLDQSNSSSSSIDDSSDNELDCFLKIQLTKSISNNISNNSQNNGINRQQQPQQVSSSDSPKIKAKLRMSAICVIFEKGVIERTKKFFDIKQSDEFLKSATWQKIEQIQDETSHRVSRAMRQRNRSTWEVDAEVGELQLVIPLEQSSVGGGGEWHLRIPKVSVKNIAEKNQLHEASIKNVSFWLQERNNEQYLLKEYSLTASITSVKRTLRKGHNNSQHSESNGVQDGLLRNNRNEGENGNSQKSSGNINISFKTEETDDQSGISGSLNGTPSCLVVQLSLPSIELNISEQFWKQIQKLPKAFILKKDKKQEKREKLKQKLLSNCTHKGFLKCKEEFEWNQYFVIFAGAYLYFFQDEQVGSSEILQQIYIKNSLIHTTLATLPTIPLRKQQPGFVLQPYSFTLKNRYGGCELACQERNELVEWTTKLVQKVEEYATIEELIQLKEREEEELEESHLSSYIEVEQNSASQILQSGQQQQGSFARQPSFGGSNEPIQREVSWLEWEFIGDIKQISVTVLKEGVLNNPADKATNTSANVNSKAECNYWVKLELRESQFAKRKYTHENETTIQFKYLSVLDGTFKFTNQSFQSLIHSDSQTSSSITIVKRDPRSKNNNQNKQGTHHFNSSLIPHTEILCNFESLLVNWKPDTIIQIRSWVRELKGLSAFRSFPEEEILSLEGLIQAALKRNSEREHAFTNSEQTVLDKRHILTDHESSVLAGRTTHIGIFQLHANQIENTFKKTAESKFLLGTVQQLTLFDTTNYPYTIDSNLQGEKILPQPLIGQYTSPQQGHTQTKMKFPKTKKCMASYRFSSFQDENIFNKERITSFLQIDFSETFVVYQQQPIMRAINYVINYLVWIFTQPECLVMNDDYFARLALQPGLQPKQVWGSKIEMLCKILFPTYMDIRINLENSVVQIKPFPQFTEYFQLAAETFEIYNSNFTTNRRYKSLVVPKGSDRLLGLYEEDWLIHVYPMKIQHVKDSKIIKDITTLTRYNMKWNRLNFAPNLVFLFPELEKVLDRGFWIKSTMEPVQWKLFRNEYIHLLRMIIHNFTQNDQKDHWFNHSHQVQQLFKPAEMNFYVDFPEYHLFAMSRVDEIPHCKLEFDRMRLKWLRDDSFNVVIAVYAEKFRIRYYEKSQNGWVIEKALLGEDIQLTKRLKMQGQYSNDFEIDRCLIQDKSTTSIIQSSSISYGFEDSTYNEKQAQFTFYENMLSPSGDKDMLLKLSGVKIIMKSSVIMSVAAWQAMQQDCWPHKDTYDELNRIVFMAQLVDCHLILPSQQSDLVLFTHGEISYVFTRQKMKQPEDFRNQMMKELIDNEFLNDMGDIVSMSVTVKDLELYRCNFTDLHQRKLKHIPRRSILMPMNFLWKMKKYLQISGKPHFPIYYNVKHDINLDDTAVKFSYKDIHLVKRAMEYQKADLLNVRKDPEQLRMQAEEEELMKQDGRYDQITPQQTVFDCVIHGLKVYVINEGEGSCVPVLEVAIEDSQMVYNKSNVKSIISAITKFNVEFYNPSTSRWEPVVEHSAIDFDGSFNNFANPRKCFLLELNPQYEELAVNLSKELLNIIKHTTQSWERDAIAIEAEEKAYVQRQREHQQAFMHQITEEPDEQCDDQTSSDQSEQPQILSALSIYQNRLTARSRFSQPQSSSVLPTLGLRGQLSSDSSSRSQGKEHRDSTGQQNDYGQKGSLKYLRETQSPGDLLGMFRETSTHYQDYEKDSLEYVSPYTIRNELGYAIQIKSDSEIEYQGRQTYMQPGGYANHPGYTIPSWTEMNYQIDSDKDSAFFSDRHRKEKRTISLSLKHPHLEFEPISGIDLDSVQKTKHMLQSRFEKDDKQVQVIVEVIPQTTRKMIIFRSSLTFINKLNETLEIQLKDPASLENQSSQISNSNNKSNSVFDLNNIGPMESSSTFFLVGPNQRLCIPFDKISHTLLFRFSQTICFSIKQIDSQDNSNKNEWSNRLIDFRKLGDITQDITSYPIKHSNDKISMIKFIKRSQGECIIQAEPSIIVKNCLPLFMKYKLYFENTANEVRTFDGTLQIQQEVQSHYVSMYHRVLIQVQIPGYQWSQKALLYSYESSETQVDRIEVFDHQQYSQFLEVSKQESIFGSKKYFLYTPQFVINETPYDIFFFTQIKKTTKITSGQRVTGSSIKEDFYDQEEQRDWYSHQKISMLSNYQNLLISLNQNGDFLSEKLDLTTFGKKSFDLKVPIKGETTSLYQFGMNVSLICADSIKQIYVKCITISPRYILVNKTRFSMSVCQNGEEKCVTIVEADSRLPFYWSDCEKKHSLRVRVQDENENLWGWSGPIEVEDTMKANMVSFCLRNEHQPENARFMKLDIREDEQLVYLVIHECNNIDDAVYFIENKLIDINVQIGQQGENLQFEVESQSECQFGWEKPRAEKLVTVNLLFKGKYEGQYEIEPLILDLEDNDSEREYEIGSLTGQDQLKVYIMICLEGSTKKVKFYSELEIHERNRLEDNLDIQVGANIKSFSVALISWNKLKRQEIALCTLKQIEFVMLQTQTERTCQVKLGFIQIDNNLSLQTPYPVVFTPSLYEKMQKLNRPHFSLILVQNINGKNIKIIKSVKCQLQASTVRLSDSFLDNLIHFAQECTQPIPIHSKTLNSSEIGESFSDLPINSDMKNVLNKNNRSSTSQSLFGDNNVYVNGLVSDSSNNQIPINNIQSNKTIYLNQPSNGNNSNENSNQTKDTFEWQYSKLPNVSGITYINEIEIYPIDLDLSFKANTRENTSNQSFFVLNIFKAIGLAFKNVDNASVKLKRTKLQNMLDTTSGAIRRIIKNYYMAVISIFLNMIGSLNLFANPLGFAKSIYIGFSDLISYPIEGFIKGPIEGSISVFKGVGSLAKNTISGSFNSIQSLAEPLSTVCCTLSLDDVYQEKRAQIFSFHPSHLFEGIGLGAWALFAGIHRGAVGLFDMPYNEGKKKGVVGVLKGTMKGISGLFFKPFCGGFDFVAKTAEGIKNTVTFLDDKPSNTRIRRIRSFYGIDQYYKEFNEEDARIAQLFNDYMKSKYREAAFIGAFVLHDPATQNEKLLAITLKYIILMQKHNNRFLWDVDTRNISEIQSTEDTIKIMAKLSNRIQIFEISNLSKEAIDIILDKINFVKENVQIQRDEE